MNSLSAEELRFLIEIHTIPETVKSYKNYADKVAYWIAQGILEEGKYAGGSTLWFKLSPKGEAWLLMILATPFPVEMKTWMDPRTGHLMPQIKHPRTS